MTEPSDEPFTGLDALGPFFAVAVHDPRTGAAEPWRPMAELTSGPAALTARSAAVREHLARGGGQPVEAVEARVAVSAAHLGLAARLLSPLLGAAVLHGTALPSGLGLLRWQPVLGGAFPLSFPDGPPPPGPLPLQELAVRLTAEALDGPLRELAETAAALGVPRRVLDGNTASAVHAAAAQLGRARPELADRARELAGLLLDGPALRGTSDRDGGGRFRRRSCCLIYRAAPDRAGPVCGDCILTRRGE